MLALWHNNGFGNDLKLLMWSSVLLLLFAHDAVADVEPRQFRALTSSQLRSLVSRDASKAFDLKEPNSHLSKILIPRAPDTANNTLVKDHIVSTLKALHWDVEEDAFTDLTPYGTKHFTNVIATKDPDAPRRVVLAAHFDSKFFDSFPANQFVGATDSAMPCALMLDVAESLNQLLDSRKKLASSGVDMDAEEADEVTLQLIFFDGEEAFKDWTDTDSIYGARHLADKWDSEYIPPHPARRLSSAYTRLSGIENLILLDLLGAKDPSIRSYFLNTAWMFDGLIEIEKRIEGSNFAKTDRSFFVPRTGPQMNYNGIGDDHLPFLHRGVPILHIIANPFPRVWHTLKDDASALDMATMKKWNLIFRLYMAEYLGLRPETNRRSVHETGELVGHLLESLVSQLE